VQQRIIEGYATQRGFALAQTFVERGVSGGKPFNERPEGKALLAKVRAGDIVITPKLDRMFRSALDALGVLRNFQTRSISLHMIDLGGDTAVDGISRLMFTVLSAVAEAERDRMRERLTEVKQDQRQRGRYLGGAVPFGFKTVPDESGKGKLLEPIPEQQRAIRRMVELRELGFSLRAIQVRLVSEGFPRVNHDTIATALRNMEAASP
jgi:DNA invertase Pin-like site-specific DNA recombinase